MFFLQQLQHLFFAQIALSNNPEGPSEEVQTPKEPIESVSPDWVLSQAETAKRDALRSQQEIDTAIWRLEGAEGWNPELVWWEWDDTIEWDGDEGLEAEVGWTPPEESEWGETTEVLEWVPEELLWHMTPEERTNFSELPNDEQTALLDNLAARQGEALLETASEIATELWIEWFWEGGEAGEADLQERLDALSVEERQRFETMTAEEQREFIRWLYAEQLEENIAAINAALVDTEARITQWWLSAAETWALQQRAWALWAMQWTVGGAPRGTPWVGWSGGERGFYRGGIGEPLTPELLAEYGWTGHELASWLQQNNFPVYNGQPNYCGQNVGEALNAFGIQWLPTSWRHGYMWSSIMADRPSQFRQISTTPQEAPAGAIISYDRGTGGSSARQQYGHVEIALWWGRGFYFWQVASWAWWSNWNPPEGSYQIFMPTSQTPGENPNTNPR